MDPLKLQKMPPKITSSLVLSALMGILIPVFGGTVIYGAKKIAEYTTRKIVAAEKEVWVADKLNAWRNDQILKNATEEVIKNQDLLSRSILLQDKNFVWDLENPLTMFYLRIGRTGCKVGWSVYERVLFFFLF